MLPFDHFFQGVEEFITPVVSPGRTNVSEWPYQTTNVVRQGSLRRMLHST